VVAKAKLTVAKPPSPPAPVLPFSKFVEHKRSLGGKSLHLAQLRPQAGEYEVPPSATVPFGVFEQVLADKVHEDFRADLEELIGLEKWAEVRALVTEELAVPGPLEAAVSKELAAVGAPIAAGAPWQRALKSVWASKWTDRAVSSRRQMGVPEAALTLAVLAQPLAFASYAFVIHTRSPLAGAREGDALVEVVLGLGESLVSNSPGRALSASVGPGKAPITLHSLPSKPDGVFAPEAGTHIFRSDSNGEDLEGFAGAGLYDSVTVEECSTRPVNYTTEPLFFDAAFREDLLRRLFDLGRLVEANFGGKPQDIEGAVTKQGGLVVVQSRPQV
jgi:alpha-glucan,water dikinase